MPVYSDATQLNSTRRRVELRQRVVIDAGLDELTCKHLKYSHPIIIVILCKLFNLFVVNGHVPESFGRSYMAPIPKGNVCTGNRALTLDDFRGISISPVISKLFEHAILDRFGH